MRHLLGSVKLVVFVAAMMLLVACGGQNNAKPTASTQVAGAVKATEPTAAPAAAQPTSAPEPTAVSQPVSPAANTVDLCALLTKDAVSKVLEVPVVDMTGSTDAGSSKCQYTTADFEAEIDAIYHVKSTKFIDSALANLGDSALVVSGLGDRAFYNASPDNTVLFVLKGETYLNFSMLNSTVNELTPDEKQAKEKALAVLALSQLP